jgi:DNA helicase II / ATP-dependent DNA helicase PcrA
MDKVLILKELNEHQKQAAVQTEGPVLIIAGAGSGKTKTITHRLAYLMATGISADNIIALTFTNKAAEEMKNRVANILEKKTLEYDKPFVGTFHRLGVKILRELWKFSQRNKNFAIFDEDDSRSLIKKCLIELNLPKEQFNYGAVREEISRAKSELINNIEYEKQAMNFFQQNVAKVYHLYEEKLIKSNGFDFDDLLKIPVDIFMSHPDILEKYQNRWKYIMVDEYQDTNTSQYTLIKMLASKYRNLCVVGDDDQSIYSWRQADFRNFLNFDKDWPDTKIVVLKESYRLTKNILKAAQEIIRNNQWRKEKVLITNNSEGSPVFLVQTKDEMAEADFVVDMIDKMLDTKRYELKDFAVLYRVNAQSRVLEEAFLKHGIAYDIFAGTKFYERKEIKDLLAYLRISANPDDLVGLERILNVPARGIGEKKMDKVFTSSDPKIVWANLKNLPEANNFVGIIEEMRKLVKVQTVSSILRLITEKIKYKEYLEATGKQGKERWQNVLEFLRLAEDFDEMKEQGLEKFLEQVALFQEGDSHKRNKNSVQLMTLHSAKGLEFKIVFIVGCEEGILPHSQSQFSEEEIEEERRLAYVGMTRAKQEVYLVLAFKRRLFGSLTVNPPSRFLGEIPQHLYQIIETDRNSVDFADPDYPEIEGIDLDS